MSLNEVIARQLCILVKHTYKKGFVRFADSEIRLCKDLRTMIHRVKYAMQYDDEFGVFLKQQYDDLVQFLKDFVKFKRRYPHVKIPGHPICIYDENSFIQASEYLNEVKNCLISNTSIPEGYFTILAGNMFENFDNSCTVGELEELLLNM